jgi:FkbM family methyltransferase
MSMPESPGALEPESPGYLLDIGANVGSYTLANLEKYGRAVCVDASPYMCDAMRARLPAGRCEVVRALVSGDRAPEFFVNLTAPGISTCCEYWRTGGRFAGALYDTWERVGTGVGTGCEVLGLDGIVARFGPPAFIKIDVEGHEESVIGTLTSRVCPLAFEWAEEMLESAVNCVRRLSAIGYSAFAIQARDDYTYEPPATDFVSAGAIEASLRASCDPGRKELWGMIWAK